MNNDLTGIRVHVETTEVRTPIAGNNIVVTKTVVTVFTEAVLKNNQHQTTTQPLEPNQIKPIAGENPSR